MIQNFTLSPSNYLYHCLYVDEFNTPENKIDRLIEDVVKEEAEMWEWPKYEWIKHKVVSEFARPDYNYYIVEVGEKE